MSEATSIQKWGSYDQEEAERDKKETETKGVFFKVTKEKTTLRFLPPRRGVKNPFVKTYQHYTNLVEGNDKTRVIFNCPRKMMNQPCPVCAMAERKRATGREDDRERAYDLFPKLRVYAAVIDRSDPDKGVQIYPIGKKIFSALVAIREDGEDFTHPINGFDIAILKKGSKKTDTEYTVKAYRKDSPLSEDPEQFNEWIDALPDLTTYAYVPNAAELQAKLEAAQDAADAEDDEDEAPARRSGREDRGGRRSGGGGREERMASRGRERPIDTKGETVADDKDVWGDDEDDDDIPY